MKTIPRRKADCGLEATAGTVPKLKDLTIEFFLNVIHWKLERLISPEGLVNGNGSRVSEQIYEDTNGDFRKTEKDLTQIKQKIVVSPLNDDSLIKNAHAIVSRYKAKKYKEIQLPRVYVEDPK